MILLLAPLLAGLALFIAAGLAGRWLAHADPKRIANMLRSGSGALITLVGVFLLFRGQFFLGGTLVAAGLQRMLGGGGAPGTWGPFPGGPRRGSPRPGQASRVRTALIEATLDHDTGDIDGTVRAGPFAGQTLSAMSDGDLLALHAEASDAESRLLLEAYLDRRIPGWREDVEGDDHPRSRATGGSSRGGGGGLSEQDAYDILGLQPGASEAEIRAAHRRLMKQMHPDQGGSTFMAARINEAKDILLRRRK